MPFSDPSNSPSVINWHDPTTGYVSGTGLWTDRINGNIATGSVGSVTGTRPTNATFATGYLKTATTIQLQSYDNQYFTVASSSSVNLRNFWAAMSHDMSTLVNGNQVIFGLGDGVIYKFGLYLNVGDPQIWVRDFDGTTNQATGLKPRSSMNAWLFVATASGWTLYLNDASYISNTPLSNTTYTNAAFQIAMWPTPVFIAKGMCVGDMVVGNASASMTGSNVTDLLTYLRNKNNVPVNPTGHLILVGDSITAGIGSTQCQDYKRLLDIPTNTAQWCLGVSGETLATAASIAAALVDPLATALIGGVNKVVLSVFEGTNDLFLNSVSGATLYSNTSTYHGARKSANPTLKTVTWTMLSRVGAGGLQTERVTFNTDQRGNFSFADALVNITDTNLDGGTAFSNATYFADQVHPTSVGYALSDSSAASAVIKPFFATGGPNVSRLVLQAANRASTY